MHFILLGFLSFESGYRPFPNAVLLGYSGSPLTEWLMTPILNPTTQHEETYNVTHCSTRHFVECACGILKSCFTCLRSGIRCFSPKASARIIYACFILHNILQRAKRLNFDVQILISIIHVKFMQMLLEMRIMKKSMIIMKHDCEESKKESISSIDRGDAC